MIQKGLAAITLLALCAFASASGAQASHSSSATRPSAAVSKAAGLAPSNPEVAQNSPAAAAPPAALPAAAQATPETPAPGGAAATPGARTDCFGGNCDVQQPRISIATPAPAPAPWLWQQRVAWGANIVLVVLGYIALMMGLSLLRKIERQTRYAEESAQAASDSARAALKHAEALERAERPWILMSVRPAPNIDNGFTVIATNRGRGPARIVSLVEEVVCAVDESHLDPTPVFKNEPAPPPDPTILLPGESIDLMTFSRSDLQQIVVNEERMKRIENWDEKLYLYGKVEYRDLAVPDDAPIRESSWFCWYIHGKQKSGMVMAGPLSYNRHT